MAVKEFNYKEMRINQFLKHSTLKSLIFVSLFYILSCSKNNSEGIDKSTRPDLYTYVPDDNFEQLLINQGYDDRLDNYITNADVVDVTQLLFTSGYNGSIYDSSGITDFTGIEAFVSLESFDCSSLNLTSIDLSLNTALKSLNCSDNNFTSLNLDNLVALEYLDCSYNNLTTLSFNSSNLQTLYCNENNLSELDLSSTNSIISLVCSSNNLSSINISSNTNLNHLQASVNLFDTLDISENVALDYMDCQSNPFLSCIRVNESQLSLDWAFCSNELFSLSCY